MFLWPIGVFTEDSLSPKWAIESEKRILEEVKNEKLKTVKEAKPELLEKSEEFRPQEAQIPVERTR